jgi:hypothetical protein
MRDVVVLSSLIVFGGGIAFADSSARDLDDCNPRGVTDRRDGKVLPDGIKNVLAVGDEPYGEYTQIDGHMPGKCEFVAGPALRAGVITREGVVIGTCGSARREFLARKVVKVVASRGASAGGLDLVTDSITIVIGKTASVEAIRLDKCGRELRHWTGPSPTRWSYGTCRKLVKAHQQYGWEAKPVEDFAKPGDEADLEGLAAGTCTIRFTANGVTGSVRVTVVNAEPARAP